MYVTYQKEIVELISACAKLIYNQADCVDDSSTFAIAARDGIKIKSEMILDALKEGQEHE
jgi:hypothetical protein